MGDVSDVCSSFTSAAGVGQTSAEVISYQTRKENYCTSMQCHSYVVS